MSTPASCTCSPTRPHVGEKVQDLVPGVTHYVSTRAYGHTRLVENDDPRDAPPPDSTEAHVGETVKALQGRIDAALKELALPHPERAATDWLNAGGAWSTRAARARRALGADR